MAQPLSRLSDIAANGDTTLAKTHGKRGVSLGIRREYMSLDLASSGKGARSRATVAKRPVSHARTVDAKARAAVIAFLRHMHDEVGHAVLAFSVWHASYEDLRREMGWPPVSEKVLSLAMQEAGCRRKQVDARKRGKGRYIAFEMRVSP